MARIARIVAPGIPHHITQRGNRRQPTFFQHEDYQLYLALTIEWCHKHNVKIWAYCLMPNHVHLIAVPEREECLRHAIGEIHQRYTREINFRMGWRGHLWQGRFHSCPMDESYLLATARYIEVNPVKANMVERPQEYIWSSARHHCGEYSDPLLLTSPFNEMVNDWQGFLSASDKNYEADLIRKAERSGRPLGSQPFIEQLERVLGRRLQKKKPGRRKGIK